MPRPVLATPRLRLEPMTTDDLPLLVSLDADADVLRLIIGRARAEEEVAEFWGPKAADTGPDALGLGFWVGFDTRSEEFVGWWDLEPAGDGVAEAGWRLARRWWRQGLASEGAAALLDHGFGTAGLDRVYADTMAVNLASRGVMRRLGMRHVRSDPRPADDPLPGAEHGDVVYEISAQEWARRRPRPAAGRNAPR